MVNFIMDSCRLTGVNLCAGVQSNRDVLAASRLFWNTSRLHSGFIPELSKMAGGKYYSVRVGRVPGVYATWPDCQQQVLHFRVPVCGITIAMYLWSVWKSLQALLVSISYVCGH